MELGTKRKRLTKDIWTIYQKRKLGEKQNFALLEGRQRLKDRFGFQIPKLFFGCYYKAKSV